MFYLIERKTEGKVDRMALGIQSNFIKTWQYTEPSISGHTAQLQYLGYDMSNAEELETLFGEIEYELFVVRKAAAEHFKSTGQKIPTLRSIKHKIALWLLS